MQMSTSGVFFLKYQSLANNMFISEHAVYLSQAHNKEQQMSEKQNSRVVNKFILKCTSMV